MDGLEIGGNDTPNPEGDHISTFGTEAGDLVLKDLQNRCHKRDTTFAGVERTFVNEGKRQVLLHIENMMSPEGIANLAEEPEKEG